MQIIGISAGSVSATTGNAVVGATGSLTYTFLPGTIWGHAALQTFLLNTGNGTDGGTDVYVGQYIDADGVHNVRNIGQFAAKCTSITYNIGVGIGAASALCITEFYDIPQW
jgi:hypothetical protein